MAVRTNQTKLGYVIEVDSNLASSDALDYFITSASLLVDKVEACDTAGELSATHLEHIETLLAAHFYAQLDQQYKEKQTLDAKGVFRGKTDMFLKATLHGQNALALDTTGCLAGITATADTGNQTINVDWGGKVEDDKIEYEDW